MKFCFEVANMWYEPLLQGILLEGDNRVRLVFQGVAALAENMMDGPLRAPKEGIMLALRHKATTK